MCINVIYLGYNDFRVFKRGVENVIIAQSKSSIIGYKYYIFFGKKNEIYRWDDIICISVANIFLLKYFLYNYWLWKIKRKKKTLIHSHNYIMTLFAIYNTDIFTIHDAIYYQRKSNREKHFFLFYLIEKIAYMRIRKIHVISLYTLSQALINKRQKRKVVVIYNTTPFEDISIAPYEKVKDKKSFNLFAVRGIQLRTRIDLLIDFAEYIKGRNLHGKRVRIYLAGKGDLLEYYRKKVKEKKLDNIVLLGYVSDANIVKYYQECDMVIMPCEYAEGFGLPIIEGYYFNKPVIASNRCAVPEIICSQSYLFENTPEAIWNTLISVFNIEFDYREYYDKRFSSEQMVSRISELYQEMQ